uniref:Uncharacterized protein n=1 Tax=Cucumis melo TaxID=3656 RepID=A0A9I9E835_CUCME
MTNRRQIFGTLLFRPYQAPDFRGENILLRSKNQG